jgi:hypothetical protein
VDHEHECGCQQQQAEQTKQEAKHAGIPGPTGNATAYRADPAGSIAVMSNR